MTVKITLTDTTTLKIYFSTCSNLTDVRSLLNGLGPWITVNENKLINQAHIIKIESVKEEK